MVHTKGIAVNNHKNKEGLLENMENRNYNKFLFYYIRISLIIGVFLGIFILLSYAMSLTIPSLLNFLSVLVLVIIIPAYLILPGLIYKPFKRNKPLENGYSIPIDQIGFYFLTVITLGIVPSFIYFLKYDSDFKNMIMKNKEVKP